MRRDAHSQQNIADLNPPGDTSPMSEPSGCLGFLSRLFASDSPSSGKAAALPKVMVNKFFVSNAEADFFRVLTRVVGNQGHILAQVSLGQLLYLPGSNQSNPGRGTWQNKIKPRSIDFVICDPATLRPLVAIELDEPSHTEPRRQTRDDEVERIVQASGLPLLHVITSRNYDTRELAATILPHLKPR